MPTEIITTNDISQDIAADTGSTTKVPSVAAVEAMATANVDLSNYYNKAEVDTKDSTLQSAITAINNIIGNGEVDADTVVDTLAEMLSVFSTYQEGTDIATILASKVDKETGKSLLANTEITRLLGIATGATQNISDSASAALMDSKDAAVLSTVNSSLSNKVDKVAGKGLSTNDYDNTEKAQVAANTSAIANKVDKVAGKQLSTNDYTTAEKNQLATNTNNIATNATAIAGKVDSDGAIAALDNGRSGLLRTLRALGSPLLTQSAGVDQTDISTSVAVASQNARVIAMVPTLVQTVITGASFYQVVQGSFTGNNFNGIGLYSYSAGTLTKIAETANNEVIWKNPANTIPQVPFLSPVTVSANTLLYVVLLFSASGTPTATPTVGVATSAVGNAAMTGLLTNSAKIQGLLLSQTTLPSAFAISSVANLTNKLWAGLY